MTNLPVPVPSYEVPGSFITGALWNANSNGLTFLLTRPAFFGYQSTVQSIASNASVAINLDTESIDSYGGHSTSSSNSRYVAQLPGWYWVQGTVNFNANTTAGRCAFIMKNGSTVPGAFGAAAGATPYTAVSASCFVYLNGLGDYVELWGYQNCGSALSTSSVNGQTSSLSALWIYN